MLLENLPRASLLGLRDPWFKLALREYCPKVLHVFGLWKWDNPSSPLEMRRRRIVALQEASKVVFLAYILVLAGGWTMGCSFSRPPAKNIQGTPVQILKWVCYSKEGAIHAYFSLGDPATNQVASSGTLRLRVFTTSNLSVVMEDHQAGSTMVLQNNLYDGSYGMGITNFHWETYGSFFRVEDLVVRLRIPYESLRTRVPPGRVVTVRMDFTPDNSTNRLAAAQKIVLY